MIDVYVKRGSEAQVASKLSSVLSRINMIYNCVPDYLYFYMDNVMNNVNHSLKKLGCNVKISGDRLFFLDKVSLYMELNNVYNDLKECSLVIFDTADLTFSLHNVEQIMEKMAEYDSVFNYCYQKSKKRVYAI